MKRGIIHRIGAICFAVASLQAGLLFAAPSPAATGPTSLSAEVTKTAVIIELKGPIDDYTRDAVKRRFMEARELGAQTIILEINSYGGLVTSGLDISRFLKQQDDLHVIAFVDEKAISAGAMIALACDEIVMQPNTLLGDSAPIAMSPGGGMAPMPATERAKEESPILEDFYNSAIHNGYDPLLLQSMVSVGRTVHWVENQETGRRRFVDAEEYKQLTADENWKPVEGVRNPVDSADDLLTVGADLAVQLGLAKGIAPSSRALAEQRGLNVVAVLAPGGAEKIVAMLGSMWLRGILMTIFMFSLYMSFSSPGHGLPEAAALSSLGLMLGVPLLTGYAQWWEVIVILLGLVLIAMEIFVIPGFGVAGIIGITFMLFGLVMTFVGDEPVEIPGLLPSLQGTWQALGQGVVVVVLGLSCSLFLWFWLSRYLPSLPYFNRLILTEIVGGPAPDAAESLFTAAVWPQIGAAGRAVTDLRPGGTAEFYDDAIADTRLIDVVSDSGFVRAGTDLIVREISGNRVVVRST